MFRIVVSAPYGQAQGETVRLARSTTLQATGVIYTCPLNPGSCEGLRGDGAGEDRRLYDVDGWFILILMYTMYLINCTCFRQLT